MANRPSRNLLWYLNRAGVRHASETDDEILARFTLRRDQPAFEELVRRHGALVWGVCRRALRDVHLAEDAFQATFLVLTRKAGTLDGQRPLAGWLHCVAARIARRARVVADRRSSRECELAESPAAELPSPETPALLDDEIQQLPEKYRTPTILCYLQGKTYAEAARQLGWPAGTVAGRLARARALLRRRLARRGVRLPQFLPGIGGAAPAAMNKAAALYATHPGVLTGPIAARVLTLAEGGLVPMGTTKLPKLVVLLLLAVMGAGAGLGWRPTPAAGQAGTGAGAAPPAPIVDLTSQLLGDWEKRKTKDADRVVLQIRKGIINIFRDHPGKGGTIVTTYQVKQRNGGPSLLLNKVEGEEAIPFQLHGDRLQLDAGLFSVGDVFPHIEVDLNGTFQRVKPTAAPPPAIEGVIIGVGDGGRRLIVDDSREVVVLSTAAQLNRPGHYRMTDQTKILIQGQEAHRDDLREGTRVAIYLDDTGKAVREIVVGGKKRAAGPIDEAAAQDELAAAKELLERKSYARARLGLTDLLQRHPQTPAAAAARKLLDTVQWPRESLPKEPDAGATEWETPLKQLRSPIRHERTEAVAAFARMGPKADPAVPALIAALREQDDEIQAAAAEALGKIGAGAKAAVPTLVEAMASADPLLRATAIRGLAGIGAKAAEAVPALTDAVENDTEPMVRIQAARALGRIGPAAEAAVPALAARLEGRFGDSFKEEIVVALGRIGPHAKAAGPALRRLREDLVGLHLSILADEVLRKIEKADE